jgi:hypothetical protein
MEEENKEIQKQLDVENIEPIEGNVSNHGTKQKYSTIQEYLEKLLYPSLKIAISDLINEIKSNDYYNELENEFNHCFFRNKAEILQKQKQLLKLERGDDYSESDYEYWLEKNYKGNDSKTEKDNDGNDEDIDPDLDDSDVLNLEEEQLNKEEEEENKNKFDPIKFLVERLRQINLNKNNHQDDLDLSLEKSELNEAVNDSGDIGKDILNPTDENKNIPSDKIPSENKA